MIIINLTGKSSVGQEWKCDVVGDSAETITKVEELMWVDEKTPGVVIDSNISKLVQIAESINDLSRAVINPHDRHHQYVAIDPPEVMAVKLDIALRKVGLIPVRSRKQRVISGGSVREVHMLWVENSANDTSDSRHAA